MSELKKNISIIYYQKNNSPKYLEINKEKFILFLVGLPTITLVSLALGMLGLLQTSPFHMLDNYRQNAKARVAAATNQDLISKNKNLLESNSALLVELENLKKIPTPDSANPLNNTRAEAIKCPEPVVRKETTNIAVANSIGLSTLSLFKPIQGQKDKTQPASLNLTGFKVLTYKDSINLQFNIINLLGGDVKLAGHIIVLMKNELALTVYPTQALNLNDSQINFSAGEPFATQRFRPVDAAFPKPKKAGNYKFTVYIFAKNGDLIHYQGLTIPVKI